MGSFEVNHQPTQVAVLGKETRSKLYKILVEKHASEIKPNPDYIYCPKEWSIFIKIGERNAV